MSTGKNNIVLIEKSIGSQRFAQIAKLGQIIFHAKDLANLWQIREPNTLYVTLGRYVKKGLIFRIHKGFYALKPVENLDSYQLGVKALSGYGYISAETVLANNGIIFQNQPAITLISSHSKKFSIGHHQYHSRKLADKFLYNGAGIVDQRGIKIATVERAAADILYFNSKAFFDAANLIDWKKVKELQELIGYPKTSNKILL